jgi:hypothetical protein
MREPLRARQSRTLQLHVERGEGLQTHEVEQHNAGVGVVGP